MSKLSHISSSIRQRAATGNDFSTGYMPNLEDFTNEWDETKHHLIQLDQLTRLREGIAGRGRITISDIFAAESIDGDLKINSSSVPALEAIDGKIRALVEGANKTFEKIIKWVIERVGNFVQRIEQGRLKNTIARFRTFTARGTALLQPSEVRRLLGDELWEKHVVKSLNLDGFNHMFKSDLSITDFEGLRAGASGADILAVIARKKGVVPINFGSPVTLNMLCSVVQDNLLSLSGYVDIAEKTFYKPIEGEPIANRIMIGKDHSETEIGNENSLQSVVYIKEMTVDQFYKVSKTGTHIAKTIQETERKLKSFLKYVKVESPEQVAAYKEFRERTYDGLRAVQEDWAKLERAVFMQAAVMNLVNALAQGLTKENVMRIKNTPSTESTSAVDASARGTMNQDPFSVNLADGVGQGAEPEISPTAPDDALNQNSDDIKYLNDTDHSQGATEENLIETVLETIADTDCGDHEYRGDYHSAPAENVVNDAEVEAAWMQSQDVQQTVESLNLYLAKWDRIGICQRDVAAVESRVVGLLTEGVHVTYTITASDTNLALAQERVRNHVAALTSRKR